jgi:hypothetical protein
MSTSTVSPGHGVHGSSALGDRDAHPRHFVGNALRAVKVFAAAVVDVVILGTEGKPH